MMTNKNTDALKRFQESIEWALKKYQQEMLKERIKEGLARRKIQLHSTKA